MRRDAQQRGFVLLVVMMIIAMLASTLAVSLRQANTGLREAAELKSGEIAYGSLNRGLASAIDYLEKHDAYTLMANTSLYNIFSVPIGLNTPLPPPWGTFIAAPPPAYPVPVLVGIRGGQKTQAAPGEDVRSNYGFVVEVLVQADLAGALGNAASAQERVTIGVKIPVTYSQAN